MDSLRRRNFGTVILAQVLGRAFTLILFFLGFASATLADTVFVKSDGNDTNPCTREKPCREISHTLDVVDAGGEIVVLDSGLYKSITIKKSVTIDVAAGEIAVVLPSSAQAIKVEASGTVVLRGLTLITKLTSSIFAGIRGANTNLRLVVDRCEISGFLFGIEGQFQHLTIDNTIVRDCDQVGVQIASGDMLINRSRFQNNDFGIWVGGKSRGTIVDTISSGNSVAGVTAQQSGQVTMERCVVTSNFVGIKSDPTTPFPDKPTVRIANSVITNNQTGLKASGGGQILTRGPASNTLVGNVADGIFTSSYAAR